MRAFLRIAGRFVRLAGLALGLAAFAAPVATAQDGKIPIGERPMYGTASWDSDVIKADEALLQKNIERGYSREQVFKAAITAGWSAYRGGELGIAMRRFNQAWLLNPDDGNVYWGFAIVVEARDGNLERSADFLARARSLLPNDPDLLVDSARVIGSLGKTDEAIEFYQQALALNPNLVAADQGLAMSYAFKGDFRRALVHAERAEERGASMPKSFMQDIRRRAN